MIYDFSETKKKNDLMEDRLQGLKEAYLKPQMSEEQLEKLRIKMEEANMANKKVKETNSPRSCE